MFWRWFMIFILFAVAYIGLFFMNFWHLKVASGKEIFGLKFSSYWTFLLFFILLSAPVIFAANYLFYTAYHFGKNVWCDVFYDKFWIMHLTNSAATVFSLLILTWFCFGEMPSKGTLAGLILVVAAVAVSIFWK